ncbi:MAG TPA: FAD-binding oxidoreductase [Nitrososphaerales archaeon]|nr:FAD-binding oxidoreductase [Nitrososphaerales archaeon]
MNNPIDVAILGGGSTGSSILYQLAKRGITRAVLLEKGSQIAAGQTSRSTALLRCHYSIPTVAKMSWDSYQFFKNDFETEIHTSSGFQKTGLFVCGDAVTEKALGANSQMLREIGIPSEKVDQDHAKKIEPYLNAAIYSLIVFEPESGYAEPSVTASAFANRAMELGSKVMTNTMVQSLKKSASGNGYEISTNNGTVEAKKVIVATGPWSKALFASLGIIVPIKPVRHPVCIFQRPEVYSGNRPLIFDFPREAYYKPEGNRFFYAGSLAAELDQVEINPDNYNESVSFDEVAKFSEEASAAVPIMGTAGVYVRGYTGVYDVTPDQQPIIDEFSDFGYEGLYCLIGLSGHGFKLSPAFGWIMSDFITGENRSGYDRSIFRLSRFKEGKLLSSRYNLSTVG